LEASIAKLTEDISDLANSIAELDAAMAKATKLRQEEKAKNSETIADSQEAQTAVAQALTAHCEDCRQVAVRLLTFVGAEVLTESTTSSICGEGFQREKAWLVIQRDGGHRNIEWWEPLRVSMRRPSIVTPPTSFTAFCDRCRHRVNALALG